MKTKIEFATLTCHRQRTNAFWKNFVQYVHHFNIFPSIPPSDDLHILRSQKMATWLFNSLLITSVAVLLFYNALIPVQKTFTVQAPAYDQYLSLFSKYSNKLQCPCRRVSTTYDQFLQLDYTMIRLCSSFLVSDQWIKFLRPSSSYVYQPYELQFGGRFAFRAISSFCQLANETIENSRTSFYKTQYVSADLTTADLFRQQNQAAIEQFELFTTKTFLSSLSLILNTTHCNSLFSGTSSNSNLFLRSPPGFAILIPKSYSNCSCATFASCYHSIVIINRFTNTVLFTVPGLYSGCHIIEPLLISSLQCFYDAQCLANVTYYVNSTVNLTATVLNASMSTKFKATSTVGEMIDQLMVEQWTSNISFANYYDQCAPSQCTYTIDSKNDGIFILTTVFGLIGGLAKILKLVVPHSVALGMRLIRNKNRRSDPATHVANIRSVPTVGTN